MYLKVIEKGDNVYYLLVVIDDNKTKIKKFIKYELYIVLKEHLKVYEYGKGR